MNAITLRCLKLLILNPYLRELGISFRPPSTIDTENESTTAEKFICFVENQKESLTFFVYR